MKDLGEPKKKKNRDNIYSKNYIYVDYCPCCKHNYSFTRSEIYEVPASVSERTGEMGRQVAVVNRSYFATKCIKGHEIFLGFTEYDLHQKIQKDRDRIKAGKEYEEHDPNAWLNY